MLRWKPPVLTLWALFVFCILCTPMVLADEAPQQQLSPDQVLVLGPLSEVPQMQDELFPRGQARLVTEILPNSFLPQAGQKISLLGAESLQWEKKSCSGQGALDLEESSAYWLATRFHLAQRSEVQWLTHQASALFCNGEEQTLGEPDDEELARTPQQLAAGWHTLYVRLQGQGALQVELPEGYPAHWTMAEKTPMTRFADSAQLAGASSLAINDGGDLLVRKVRIRDSGLTRLDVMNPQGQLLASDLGGPKARALGFLPGGQDLLMARSSSEGTDLLLWTGPAGPLETLLQDEPGLGFVKISPDGKHLLFSSTAAFDADEPVTGNRRFVHLREQVVDFTPVPHLHLLDVATGARRVLTAPGDKVLDDAVFSADGRHIYFVQTISQVERPWFHSEILTMNLHNGESSLLAKFTGGWEVRPQGLAAAPDGKTLVFLGPPDEVGGGRQEHNVYNKQIWSLDLDSGAFERRTTGLNLAFDVAGGLPRFDAKGRLLVETIDGSVQKLARLNLQKNWSVELLPLQGQSLGRLAVSPQGKHLLYTASNFDQPARLYRAQAGKSGQLVENFQGEYAASTLWADAVDASFTNSEGETIDAWFYAPLQHGEGGEAQFKAPDQGQSPLVVYYYAGSVPTMQGFNSTHQFFAANGYAVLVVNPRGAYGFGDEFADHHAGDWGPRAGADIIDGTEKILAQHPWLDEKAIGIYGGSYGGFMTEYLVTATDIYTAAVSMYGISDLATYWGQGTWGWTYGDMALGGANPWNDSKYFIEHSPLFRADRINTPLLLLHGQDDDNVTPGESQQLFTALSLLDRPVEMVLFPDEGHGISDTWDNRVQHRTMILEWFDRYCRQQPAAWQERWE